MRAFFSLLQLLLQSKLKIIFANAKALLRPLATSGLSYFSILMTKGQDELKDNKVERMMKSFRQLAFKFKHNIF